MKSSLLNKTVRVVTLVVTMGFGGITHASAQHHETADTEEHKFKHFRVSAMLYHTYIGTETVEGKELLIVPSVGLDLEYWFNEKWGIGSHNDLEHTSFIVKHGDTDILERESPVLLTVDALWRPWKGLVLLAGPGVELEKQENLLVFRGGVEYEIEIGKHWDVAPTIFYDSRIDAYDSFSIGIGIGKRF
ncbi:hypothetical protein [Pontibacter populi]|uniref:Outer membrane protein beta-barrel domain-containing protein n=1 Tax=Pontibacter populi TaxID=890055 RepID=A0ABV1RYG2_9BACT